MVVYNADAADIIYLDWCAAGYVRATNRPTVQTTMPPRYLFFIVSLKKPAIPITARIPVRTASVFQ
jgi:hypothetical protein